MKRAKHSTAPAALVALSMAICLGAAVDVTLASSPAHTRPDRPTSFTAAEREALASLLAYLSDTARQLQPDQKACQPLFTMLRSAGTDPAPPAPLPGEFVAVQDPLGPGTLTRAHLLNLPPPAIC